MSYKYLMTSAVLLLFSCTLQAAQTCQTAITATTPTADFTEHGDGTVTHDKTGLMWQSCSQGQNWSAGSCAGTATGYSWQQALQLPATLNVSGGYGGYSDWRLPNVKELRSIVELSCYSPAINLALFPGTLSGGYWSASPYANSSHNAWYVGFNDGYDYIGNRSYAERVRLVRGGQ